MAAAAARSLAAMPSVAAPSSISVSISPAATADCTAPSTRTPGTSETNSSSAAWSAPATAAAELLFVSDVPGVRVDGAVQSAVAAGEIETLIELGAATDGMAAKLRAAAAAIRAGAHAVRIGDWHLLAHPSAGTRILPPAVKAA